MSTDSPSRVSIRRSPQQIIIAVAVTVAVTGVLLFFHSKQQQATTAKVTKYEVVSATTFKVTFEVNKAYLAEATCVIQALDRGANVIGSTTYVVGPQIDHHRKTTHTVEIPVTGTPVTGQVESCVITRNH